MPAQGLTSNDLKQTKAAQEKERQERAYNQLMTEYPLPTNLSDMKSFAWGKFTWRDVFVTFFCLLIPALLMMSLSAIIPVWICLIIAIALAIPLVYFANRHIFTGDLPIEEQIKIAMANAGASDLLVWDKTKRGSHYVETATQNFVPEIEFTEDNYVMLPGGGDKSGGGFAVLQVTCDDIVMSKNTDKLQIVGGFNNVLNSLVNETDCTPIQILMKASLIDIESYLESAMDEIFRIEQQPNFKPLLDARANDYANMLQTMNDETQYYYDYYIIVTYRPDAEDVGNDTMTTGSVRKQKMKEKINPLRKRQETLSQVEFEIGDDRKKKLKEASRQKRFDRRRTRETLKRRTQNLITRMKNCGTTYTDVSTRLLTREEVSKLFFQCYNSTDKDIIDTVVTESLNPKTTIYSKSVYRDFPDLFRPPKKKTVDKTKMIQRHGALGRK